jgi:hypothetical protein
MLNQESCQIEKEVWHEALHGDLQLENDEGDARCQLSTRKLSGFLRDSILLHMLAMG